VQRVWKYSRDKTQAAIAAMLTLVTMVTNRFDPMAAGELFIERPFRIRDVKGNSFFGAIDDDVIGYRHP
jgi:hypothetical protein